MVHGVKCDLSGACDFCLIGLQAVSDQFVSPLVAGGLAMDIGLGNDGGNAVLLIDGPVLEFGDLWYKNWTTAVVSFYLAGRCSASVLYSMHVLMWVDLGVTYHYDNELTMKQHINRVVSSCFFQLRRLRQIRRSADEEVTKRLVTVLVLTRLDYCNAVLAGLSESTIRPMQRVQNAAALLITDTKTSDHITPVLMHLHWLPIKSQILYKLCLLMHLIHTNQRPAYLAEMVELSATYSSRSGLRSASRLQYRMPALKTKFGERAFSHGGPAAWNSLPDYIQFESNTQLFKKLLKTYLFTLSF